MPATHLVSNVVENLENYNLFAQDPVLQTCLQANGGAAYTDACQRFGEKVGSEETIRWGFEADANTPVLRTHDRQGRRQDTVDYHPAYHALMALSMSGGLHSLACEAQAAPGAHVGRAALFYMAAQNELGHGCPISMTWSVIPVLRREPVLRALWEPRITRHYDPRVIPADQKNGVIFGMAMTEKQGGSDVRANSTLAVPVAGAGRAQEYLLTGHKWFCSAPNSDAFCVLTQAGRVPKQRPPSPPRRVANQGMAMFSGVLCSNKALCKRIASRSTIIRAWPSAWGPCKASKTCATA
jgi:putative acyl-CoA dehydrogenase